MNSRLHRTSQSTDNRHTCSVFRLAATRVCLGLFVSLFASQGLAADQADNLFRSVVEETLPESNRASPLRGQLRPVDHTVLSAGVDARIVRLPVSVGVRLSAGDIIAEFDCGVEEAERRIGSARLQVARENLAINQRLDQLKNISGFDLSLSEAERAIAEAELERTDAILSRCEIRAPFPGTVTEKFIQAHQHVKQGDRLVELVDTSNLEVEMVLPSADLLDYRIGREFTLDIDETGATVAARIVRIVNVIDPVSQTIRVIGVIVDPAANLMPGMSGVINLRNP